MTRRAHLTVLCPECFDGAHSQCIGQGCYCDCQLQTDCPFSDGWTDEEIEDMAERQQGTPKAYQCERCGVVYFQRGASCVCGAVVLRTPKEIFEEKTGYVVCLWCGQKQPKIEPFDAQKVKEMIAEHVLACPTHPINQTVSLLCEQEQMARLMKAAYHCLRSYQYGNSATEPAAAIADLIADSPVWKVLSA